MSAVASQSAVPQATSAGRPGLARLAENTLLSVALLALVALPLSETVLRRLFHTGVAGSTQFVQHLTLIVSMLGAALAARDGSLLTVFEFASFARPQLRALCPAR